LNKLPIILTNKSNKVFTISKNNHMRILILPNHPSLTENKYHQIVVCDGHFWRRSVVETCTLAPSLHQCPDSINLYYRCKEWCNLRQKNRGECKDPCTHVRKICEFTSEFEILVFGARIVQRLEKNSVKSWISSCFVAFLIGANGFYLTIGYHNIYYKCYSCVELTDNERIRH
jgi:hypothetical protein